MNVMRAFLLSFINTLWLCHCSEIDIKMHLPDDDTAIVNQDDYIAQFIADYEYVYFHCY